MVREPDATMQSTPQDNQLLSKHRVLSLKPQIRLEWQGQDGQSETEQPDHSASLGDSIATSTQIRFSVHTGGRRSQSALAGLQELLGPAIIHRSGDAFPAASSEMFSSPRSPFSRMRIFSPPLSTTRRVWRRMSFSTCSAGSVRISVSSSLLTATMNRKSSLREVPQCVSGVLTANNSGRYFPDNA